MKQKRKITADDSTIHHYKKWAASEMEKDNTRVAQLKNKIELIEEFKRESFWGTIKLLSGDDFFNYLKARQHLKISKKELKELCKKK